MAPPEGLAPIALNIVTLLRLLLVVSYTMLLIATQVRPLPVTVGWFGLVEISVRLDTVSSSNLFEPGVIEDVFIELADVPDPDVLFVVVIVDGGGVIPLAFNSMPIPPNSELPPQLESTPVSLLFLYSVMSLMSLLESATSPYLVKPDPVVEESVPFAFANAP